MATNHKGVRPKAQPRTLRTIAEDKGTSPAGRDGGADVDPQAGIPMGTPGGGAGQRYQDAADAAKPAPGTATRRDPRAPKPYK